MRFLKTVFLILLCAVSSAASAEETWQPLYNRVDAEFQAALEQRLNANKEWKRLIKNKKMAIGVVDMSGPVPKFARVNGNQMMYAASLPKIAILLAAYVSFEDGSLQETDEIMSDLQNMIRVSDNAAATRMIDRIGMKKIQSILKDPQYGFYDEKRGGGLWVGKRYAGTGPRSGDPLFNISHGATATQVCRFFYLLASRRLINEHRSEEMLADLVDPHLHHKFVSQLDELAPDATLFRKSGTWHQWHSDAIMVQGTHWRNYILVGLIESEDGEQILRHVLPAVEQLMVPEKYSEGHDLESSLPVE